MTRITEILSSVDYGSAPEDTGIARARRMPGAGGRGHRRARARGRMRAGVVLRLPGDGTLRGS